MKLIPGHLYVSKDKNHVPVIVLEKVEGKQYKCIYLFSDRRWTCNSRWTVESAEAADFDDYGPFMDILIKKIEKARQK